MSSYEDYMDQIELVEDMLREAVEMRAEHGYWRSHDGRDIKISTMSPVHLKNTIRFFTEGPGVDAPGAAAVPYLQDELNRRLYS